MGLLGLPIQSDIRSKRPRAVLITSAVGYGFLSIPPQQNTKKRTHGFLT